MSQKPRSARGGGISTQAVPRLRIAHSPTGAATDKQPGQAESGLPRLGYRRSLDGLRAVAIALVVGYHYLGKPLNGALGVDLFFVLSGFLITTLLLEEHALRGAISFGRFYARRALRLCPALGLFLLGFGAVIAVHAIGVTALPKSDYVTSILIEQWGMGLSFTTNIGFALGWVPYPDTQFLWSLAVEEQYYLLWPLLLALALARPRGWRIAVSAALSGLLAIIAVHLAIEPAHASTFDAVAVTRFDGILFGCCAALVLRRFPVLVTCASSAWVWLPALLVGAFICLAPDSQLFYDGRADLFDLAGCALLLASLAPSSLPARFLSLAPFALIGRLSYAIYLWNNAILIWLLNTRWLGPGETRLGAIGVTLALAFVSYFGVEQPFLRKKWRLARVASHDAPLSQMLRGRGARPASRPETPSSYPAPITEEPRRVAARSPLVWRARKLRSG